jgi:hypothetical protein
MAGPRKIRLAAILDAFIASTDMEAARLRTIIEQKQTPHEERLQALVNLARLSNNMVSILADREVEVHCNACATPDIHEDSGTVGSEYARWNGIE